MSTLIRQLPNQIDATLREPWQVRALAIVDAVVVNVVILAIARLVMGEFPVGDNGSGEQTVGFVPVIVTTVVVGVVAALLLGLLKRVSERGKTIWTVIAIGVFCVSLTGPLAGGVDTASKIALAALHAGAAATIIPLMRRSPAEQ